MTRRIAIVFDLDGTLVDSLDDIVAAANHTLAAHGYAALEPLELAGYVGDGARLLLARAARLAPEDPALEPLLTSFLERYTAHAADHTRVRPGALEALESLADLPLALCTNKPRATTRVVLERLSLARFFRAVVADGDLPRNKPDPMVLGFVAAKLGVAASDLVMVGDGPQDIACGKAVGARTVGVLGGIAAEARLLAAGPDVLVHSLAELPAIVRRWAADAQATSA